MIPAVYNPNPPPWPHKPPWRGVICWIPATCVLGVLGVLYWVPPPVIPGWDCRNNTSLFSLPWKLGIQGTSYFVALSATPRATRRYPGTCWNDTSLLHGSSQHPSVASVGAEDGLDVLPSWWVVGTPPPWATHLHRGCPQHCGTASMSCHPCWKPARGWRPPWGPRMFGSCRGEGVGSRLGGGMLNPTATAPLALT